jgi:transaldolase
VTVVLFVDSSKLDEVRYFATWGIVAGVTTNPKIIATDGQATLDGLREQIQAICECVPEGGTCSVEVLAETTAAMVAEGRTYHAWRPGKIAVKIPMCEQGVPAIHHLARSGVPVNVTCMMNVNQAYVAALAGARYVSLFLGRIRDMGSDPLREVATLRAILEREGLAARIIAGSIRHPQDVADATAAGAHVVTVTPDVLKKMIKHPNTEATIAEFAKAWEGMKRSR